VNQASGPVAPVVESVNPYLPPGGQTLHSRAQEQWI
jgi:hypothetical protein